MSYLAAFTNGGLVPPFLCTDTLPISVAYRVESAPCGILLTVSAVVPHEDPFPTASVPLRSVVERG
jgi:hypothetical protein